ncbi:ThuA domain-containing protein [Zavarzinella formosa]|uniref:ThuA domain-containing protein n=1 Tax=Zavarzinella formosa TaxID=360055 RepID=UPI0002F61A7C|nr:ThuA domain-containing protein [Zavarzinella formosa]
MNLIRWTLACVAIVLIAQVSLAENKKLLLVTDSGGFVHDSVGLSEQILKEIGPKNGIDVTCFRYTRDPESKDFASYADRFRKTTGVPCEKENCGRVNAETLKKFDGVLFFTTGNPLTNDEVKDLVEWVKAGGAVAGVHCGSDTLYPAKDRPMNAAFGELIGAYFDGHPWHQKIKIVVEDPNHAAGKGFKTGDEITDEIYQFRPEPYSRNKLHIILSVDNSSIDVSKGKRSDKDYAISWCQEVEKGRTFYSSLGHRKEVWKDPRYQEHLIGGLKWALKDAKGDATPSVKSKKD